MTWQATIGHLRAELDRAVVGHGRAKTGLLLALAAGEHALLVGPPGAAKTRLAERFLAAAITEHAVLSFHRDLRLREIAGAPVLRREVRASSERLREGLEIGAFARARGWLLDDLGRAPGEVRAALLRSLGEGRLLGVELALEIAVATLLPEELDPHGDPLGPEAADRFALQLPTMGLLPSRRFDEAARLLGCEEGPPPASPLSLRERYELRSAARALPVDMPARRSLERALGRLRALAPDGEALLTDRSFGRAAPRVMRAHALLRGAARVEPADVRALGYMLALRLPPGGLPLAQAELEEAAREQTEPGSAVAGLVESRARSGREEVARLPALARDQQSDVSLAEPGTPSLPPAASVGALLRALSGLLERGAASRDEHPGGAPRGWRRMRRLDEIDDADPLDASLLADAELPGLPHVYRRRRREAGGSLVVLRDVSASMEGPLAHWAEQIVGGVVRVCARRRMRVGYLEFHHEALRYHVEGRFFHRRYARLLAQAARSRSAGRTNYEAPLRVALDEVGEHAGRRDTHILLLTDGVPVLGDPEVRRERARARRLGVRIHTVFLGHGESPAVLERLARETGGLRFAGRPTPGGGLRVELIPEPSRAHNPPAVV